jgi:hypothetical protein
MQFQTIGKWLIYVGVFVALVGLAVTLLPRVPWIGRLPGDIYIRRPNFSFYFPITTCLLLSIILSLLYRIFKR